MVAKKNKTAPKQTRTAPATRVTHRAAAPAKAQARKPAKPDEDAKGGATRPDEMPAEVLEFIQAIDDYKRLNRRPFPTWSEVLEVLKGLGYQRAG